MGNETDDDDALEELSDSLASDSDSPSLVDDDEREEELGIEGAEDSALAELDDGPEEIGLDVETLGSAGDELELDDDDEEGAYALDDNQLDLEGELEDALDEDGWTDESEGAGAAWEDDTLEDDDDLAADDDGGLEGVEDPSLDDVIDERETTLSIEGEDLNAEEDLERVELDLG